MKLRTESSKNFVDLKFLCILQEERRWKSEGSQDIRDKHFQTSVYRWVRPPNSQTTNCFASGRCWGHTLSHVEDFIVGKIAKVTIFLVETLRRDESAKLPFAPPHLKKSCGAPANYEVFFVCSTTQNTVWKFVILLFEKFSSQLSSLKTCLR